MSNPRPVLYTRLGPSHEVLVFIETAECKLQMVDGRIDEYIPFPWGKKEEKYFPRKHTGRFSRPGDWFAALVLVVTFGWRKPCAGCRSRLRKMNNAGWKGLPMLALKGLWGKLNGRK